MFIDGSGRLENNLCTCVAGRAFNYIFAIQVSIQSNAIAFAGWRARFDRNVILHDSNMGTGPCS